ncbi:MAG: DUF3024 domain-containing protein [Candidatus Zixiibacteriota bacterium]
MAFNKTELDMYMPAVAAFVHKRCLPDSIRNKLDIGFRFEGLSVVIFEIRPRWNDPAEITETPVAKLTFVRSKNAWKIFWMRQDLKWHAYTQMAEMSELNRALEVIDRDEYGCFWG